MLVSVIVPCYKQAQYLTEALQSVYNQTYTNWECIIVNDGSPDNTEHISKLWQQKDQRFKYVFKENGGLSSARNFGLKIAKGNYIQFLDSDDVLDEKKIEKSIEILTNNVVNEGVIVITNFRMFIDNIRESTDPFCCLVPELFNFKDILLKWETVFSIPIHCGLFEAKLLNDFNFPEELKAKEDWIMWLYLFQKKNNIYFIDEPMAFYRLNPSGMTTNVKHMQENHFKAIAYIKSIVPEKDYINYLLLELIKNYEKNISLKTTINNYQNSKTFKWTKKIKDFLFVKFLFKTIKKAQ